MRDAYVIRAKSADEFGVWDMAPVWDRVSEDVSVWDRVSEDLSVWDRASEDLSVWDRCCDDLSVWDRAPVWDRVRDLQAA